MAGRQGGRQHQCCQDRARLPRGERYRFHRVSAPWGLERLRSLPAAGRGGRGRRDASCPTHSRW
ncbi:hypothetical protein HMPREF1129_2828 [Actinomyces naeslundii str. Howell 279]|uniref:Uncharacterized protein n=1 Tax=Actinomyces naeslundii (strain ATCC 12104 / DSM 43013 / CCUG 2238 / JCM 8349 / NCTC 10301 / Howell 279) TaxID=1115803 RepID=J3JL95_ACTNH|nr:hypothetical protein HMPREF1129_2828 [Actinomyces naeslundii str. Howell 279]